MCYMNEEFLGSLIDNFCKYEEHFHIGLGILIWEKKVYFYYFLCLVRIDSLTSKSITFTKV